MFLHHLVESATVLFFHFHAMGVARSKSAVPELICSLPAHILPNHDGLYNEMRLINSTLNL